jgi:uncharacterized protein with PQ loop repeat
MDNIWQAVGLIAGVVLPLWNIPLILTIGRRRSSKDISIWWVLGVYGCLLFMLPSAIISQEIVYKAFSFANVTFFTAVVIQVLRYR